MFDGGNGPIDNESAIVDEVSAHLFCYVGLGFYFEPRPLSDYIEIFCGVCLSNLI